MYIEINKATEFMFKCEENRNLCFLSITINESMNVKGKSKFNHHFLCKLE